MSYIKAVYLDLNQCCDDFIKGIEYLEQCSLNDSVNSFSRACTSATDAHKYLPKYQSYYGFACLLSGEEKAIELCRHAVKSTPFDGDICMNLARAELFLNHRVAALSVIKTGLRYSSDHPGLITLKEKMGFRSKKPLPFLSRSNRVSNALGKRMRKR